jgi:hypothetical protein
MMTSARTVHAIPAAIFLLVQAFASPGFAQDGMQLDTMFRESLSRGRDQAKGEDERRRLQGLRHEGRDVGQRSDPERRNVKRRSEEGR